MLDDQLLLNIAAWHRSGFFKRWNQLRRDEQYFDSPTEKCRFILKDWEYSKTYVLDRRFQFVSIRSPQYPKIFFELPQPPLGFFVWGDWKSMSEKKISMIGSRKPTSYSTRMTRRCAKHWTHQGFSVVSGGAYGIDSVAHESCLCFGGKTIVVLGGGFDHLYPKQNEALFDEVINKGGCLISEYPPHEKPRNYHFPERNRLIAALGEPLFLAQAHERSGSLSTAMTALELGKEIFVLRPPPADENFRGSQKLIEAGAICLTSPRDLDQFVTGDSSRYLTS